MAYRDILNSKEPLQPVVATGRHLAKSVWGRGFCEHLERYSDFSNRLPRGRTYLRRGAVRHLAITRGEVRAIVLGRDAYTQRISITPLSAARTKRLAEACADDITAAVDLVSGQLPQAVLQTLRDPQQGIFPQPHEIDLECSCPDWAYVCKHLAAVLYGIGVRVDEQPELLFVLRGVDPEAIVTAMPGIFTARQPPPERRLDVDLGALFDIELVTPDDDEPILVARTHLVEAGLSAGQIQTWLRRGDLVRTDERGVYELAPSGWERLEPLLGA